MAQEEINNLRILVEMVLSRIKRDAENKDYRVINELLWHVPTQILQTYIKEGE